MMHRRNLLAVLLLLLLLLGGCGGIDYDRIRLTDMRSDGLDSPVFLALSAAAASAEEAVTFRQDHDNGEAYLLATAGTSQQFTTHLGISGDEYNRHSREFTLRLTRCQPEPGALLSSQTEGDWLLLVRFRQVNFSLLRVVIDAEVDAGTGEQAVYEFHTGTGGMSSQPPCAIRVNDTVISRQEIEQVMYFSAKYEATQPLSEMVHGRILNELYYQEAVRRGLQATRSAAAEYVDQARAAFLSAENATEARRMLHDQLAYLGMSEEEYWARAVTGYMKSLSVGNLKRSVSEQATTVGAVDSLGNDLYQAAVVYFVVSR